MGIAPGAESGDLRRRRLGLGGVVEVVERDVGTRLGEPQRDGAPDAALGARHENDLAGAPTVLHAE